MSYCNNFKEVLLKFQKSFPEFNIDEDEYPEIEKILKLYWSNLSINLKFSPQRVKYLERHRTLLKKVIDHQEQDDPTGDFYDNSAHIKYFHDEISEILSSKEYAEVRNKQPLMEAKDVQRVFADGDKEKIEKLKEGRISQKRSLNQLLLSLNDLLSPRKNHRRFIAYYCILRSDNEEILLSPLTEEIKSKLDERHESLRSTWKSI